MPWVNYKAEALSVLNKFHRKVFRVLYVRGKHCCLPRFGFSGSMQTSQKEENASFTHVGLSTRRIRTIIIVQEVEVHGWLLSGAAGMAVNEELTILCCSFLTLLANK